MTFKLLLKDENPSVGVYNKNTYHFIFNNNCNNFAYFYLKRVSLDAIILVVDTFSKRHASKTITIFYFLSNISRHIKYKSFMF